MNRKNIVNVLILLGFVSCAEARTTDLDLLREERGRIEAVLSGANEQVTIAYNGAMDVGFYDISVSQLRNRLIEEGYAVIEQEDPLLYDESLKAAVAFYQEDHGLTPDGVVGPATIASINDNPFTKYHKLNVAIEKLEGLNLKKSSKTIIVNIPTYTLRAYDGENLFLDSKVIVGMPSRQTPEMDTSLGQLKLNPDWTVPVSILKKDYFRKIKNYEENNLEGRGYYITDGVGSSVSFAEVASYSLDDFINRGLMLKQSSGDGNALGKVKFVLRNSDSIYLHDTNNRSLFDKSRRALSSGCVRVQDYMELAGWAYGGYISDVQDRINTGKTVYLNTDDVRVIITYLPAFVVGGVIRYADDIYHKLDM